MKKAIYNSLLIVFAVTALFTETSCGKEGLKYGLDGSSWGGTFTMDGRDSVALEDGSVTLVPNVDSVVMRAAFEGGQCRLYGYAVIYRLIDSTGELRRQYYRPVDCVGPYSYKEGEGSISTSVEHFSERLSFSCNAEEGLTINIPEGLLLPTGKAPALAIRLQQKTDLKW